MHVGTGFISLDTSECRSLKDKRRIVKSLITKANSKFSNAAVAEVGDANSFKSAEIGISVLANDQTVVESMLSKVMQYVEEQSFRTILDAKAEVFLFHK